MVSGAGPARRNRAALWFAVFGGPAAWSLDELSALSLQYDFCAAHRGAPPAGFSSATAALIGIGLVTASVAIAAGATAWRIVRAGEPDDGTGDTTSDRVQFMARAGIVMSTLCLFPIVLRLASSLMVPSSLC